MDTTNSPFRTPLLLIGLAALCSVSFAASKEVERGKYLAEEVAQCQRCHTPKTAGGELDKAKWMKGATLDVQPLEAIKGWHKTAPDLLRLDGCGSGGRKRES